MDDGRITNNKIQQKHVTMMKLPILPCADKLKSGLVYRTKNINNT